MEMKNNIRKCPLHKFGATYKLLEGIYKCDKCGGAHKIDKLIGENEGAKGDVEIRRVGKYTAYEFNGN